MKIDETYAVAAAVRAVADGVDPYAVATRLERLRLDLLMRADWDDPADEWRRAGTYLGGASLAISLVGIMGVGGRHGR